MKFTYEIASGTSGIKVERVKRDDDRNYEREEFYFSSWADACVWLTAQHNGSNPLS